MKPRKIIIRVDGGHRIGLGHVVRTRALAAMLAPEFECEFILGASDPATLAWLEEDYRVHQVGAGRDEATEILAVGRRLAAPLVVLDGYGFGRELQAALQAGGLKVVVIDDLAESPLAADLVINHGSSRVAGRYRLGPATTVLVGPAYALLRPAFIEAARAAKEPAGVAGRVLVCMGGADSLGVTPRVLAALAVMPEITAITVVLGAAAKLDTVQLRTGHGAVEVRRNLDAEGMVQALQQVRVAITTASSVAIEACAVGCGLVVGLVADNQRLVLEEVTSRGCATSVGDWRTASAEVISDSCRRADFGAVAQWAAQRAMVDGRSSERILGAFRALAA